MKAKDKSLEVNEYKIHFIYIDNPQNIHTRYFQSISLDQVKENLDKIIDGAGWELVSIEKYNRFNREWEAEI